MSDCLDWVEVEDAEGNVYLVQNDQLWRVVVVGDDQEMLAWLQNADSGEVMAMVEGRGGNP